MSKTIFARVILTFFAIFLALLLFELCLRLFTPEPQNLAKLKASSQFLMENNPKATLLVTSAADGFNNEITFNSYGFRDIEFKKEKDSGVFRIAVLGDSYEEALQVSLDNTWQKVMAKQLSDATGRKVESYNFGVSGYGTDQEWLTLEKKVWQFNPDMVILAFSPNDVGDTFKNKLVNLVDGKIKVATAEDRAGGNFLGKFLRRTYTYQMVVKAAYANDKTKNLVDKVRVKILGFPKDERFFLSDAQLLVGPFEVIASQKNPPKEVTDTRKVVEALISDMQKQANSQGAKFMVTINIPETEVLPSKWQQLIDQYHLNPADSSDHVINDVLDSFANNNGIMIYDGREDAILWVSKKGPINFLNDGHYNPNGHVFMGTGVSNFILGNSQKFSLQEEN